MPPVPAQDRPAWCRRVACFALALATWCWGPLPAAADDIAAVPLGTFEGPVYVAVAPGTPNLLFVVERPGRIQVLRNEQTLSVPFLDITDIVRSAESGGGNEEGLFSVAFPPDYAQSGRFYVAFTNQAGNLELNEFRRLRDLATRARRNSRRVLLVIPHPTAGNHNAGQLQFGPHDGLLYMATGDGGNVDPRGEAARDLTSLLGKILRIDPRRHGANPYRIPSTNPYVGTANREEIFAYGLRNPWRFSFDGWRMAIADVGQGRREEVNILHKRDVAGVNFGWPEFEGELSFDPDRPGPDPATPPMFTYSHDDGGCAVIGGYMIRDSDLPAMQGRYIYGDACTGDVRTFMPRVNPQRAADDRPSGLVLPGLSSFGQGADGKLYAAEIGGGVFRLEPPAPSVQSPVIGFPPLTGTGAAFRP
jgi:glucose/arabinose dehydrogenase